MNEARRVRRRDACGPLAVGESGARDLFIGSQIERVLSVWNAPDADLRTGWAVDGRRRAASEVAAGKGGSQGDATAIDVRRRDVGCNARDDALGVAAESNGGPWRSAATTPCDGSGQWRVHQQRAKAASNDSAQRPRATIASKGREQRQDAGRAMRQNPAEQFRADGTCGLRSRNAMRRRIRQCASPRLTGLGQADGGGRAGAALPRA